MENKEENMVTQDLHTDYVFTTILHLYFGSFTSGDRTHHILQKHLWNKSNPIKIQLSAQNSLVEKQCCL